MAIYCEKEIIEKLKKRGYYIPGPSPDMASPLQWHCSRKKIILDFPFSSGQFFKKYRMGAKGAAYRQDRRNFFSAEGLWFKLSELIPRYWSGPTIWAESAPKP
jgi:hypothetical protein